MSEPADLPAAVVITPLRFKVSIDRDVSDVGSRMMLAAAVARGTLQALGALATAGATDLRIESVTRTDKGVVILVEGTPAVLPATIEAPTPGPEAV